MFGEVKKYKAEIATVFSILVASVAGIFEYNISPSIIPIIGLLLSLFLCKIAQKKYISDLKKEHKESSSESMELIERAAKIIKETEIENEYSDVKKSIAESLRIQLESEAINARERIRIIKQEEKESSSINEEIESNIKQL